jgi:hypothetical protein
MKQMKNYVGFVNDHSGSMLSLATAAAKDYNANIAAIKDASTTEMLDTVVSVVGIGVNGGFSVERQVVISNPHVLKPISSWEARGGTPLYDGIGNLIELFESLPDAREPHVSFLLMITTDGDERDSRNHSKYTLRQKIEQLQRTGRWTFVFRVPKGYARNVTDLGVPAGNIQEWETSTRGMEQSTQATTAAVKSFYAARSAGKTSSTVFYADASQVDVASLKDISSEVSLYVVPDADAGIQIRDFILRHRMEYLKGSAFYQLTKTEPRVSHTKMIAIRDRSNGKVYAGKDARKMIGLPDDRNARLHPGDHGNYDIFIQSESVNRKLVGGTGVLYWKAIGVPFTEADLAYLKPKVDPAVPAVVQLPAVAPTNKPTPSPLKPTPTINSRDYFNSRDEGRAAARKTGKPLQDAGKSAPKGKRWYI